VDGVAMLEGMGSALLGPGNLGFVVAGFAGIYSADIAAEAVQPLEMLVPDCVALAAESEVAGSYWQAEAPALPDSSIALVDKLSEPAAEGSGLHSAATLSVVAEKKQFDM
jgi:hypothetical protein